MMNTSETISDVVAEVDAEEPKSEMPEVFGDLSEDSGEFVLLEKVKPYLWVECAAGATLEDVLGEMFNIMKVENLYNQGVCPDRTPMSPAEFVIGNRSLALTYAKRTDGLIDAFERCIPHRQEYGHHEGLADLWEIVAEFPETATTFAPNVFGGVAMLSDGGVPAVLLVDDEDDEEDW